MLNLVFGVLPCCPVPSLDPCKQPTYRAARFAPAKNDDKHLTFFKVRNTALISYSSSVGSGGEGFGRFAHVQATAFSCDVASLMSPRNLTIPSKRLKTDKNRL